MLLTPPPHCLPSPHRCRAASAALPTLAGSDDSDTVGISNEEGGGAWEKIIRGLGREEASPTHSEHFRAMKKFYWNKLYDFNA
jgi:hypothetical protein